MSPSFTPTPRRLPRFSKQTSTPSAMTSQMEPHPELEDIDTSPIEQMLGLSMSSAHGTPVGSPVVPAPPPPPSISAPPPPPSISVPPVPGPASQSVSAVLPRRTAMDASTSTQNPQMPARQSPVLPRTDNLRGRSWDRPGDGGRDLRERSRDRDRERSRDRTRNDYRGSARTADRDRSRDRDYDRWREPPTRDWKLSDTERRRRERSRERDRFRHTGRPRGY